MDSVTFLCNNPTQQLAFMEAFAHASLNQRIDTEHP